MTVVRQSSIATEMHVESTGYDPIFSGIKPIDSQPSGASGDFDGKALSLQAQQSLLQKQRRQTGGRPDVRTDHLGVIVKTGRSKHKFARTLTMVYDKEKEGLLAAEKTYKLLQDTKKVIDMSISGLRRLYRIFYDAMASADISYIGPRTFRLALAKHGTRDVILMQRLFQEFCSPIYPGKIDYRSFLRVLASMNEEPVEDKLILLFEVWDIDQSGTLTHGELAPIVVHGLPVAEMERAMERFNKAWKDISTLLHGSQQNQAAASWIGGGHSSGVSKEDLCDACYKLPSVRDFFTEILTRQPPKADDRLPLNFQSRLKELELQIKEEIKEKEKQEGAGGRPRSRRSGEAAPASPESPTTVTSPKRKPPPPAGAAFSAFSHNSSTVISSAPVLRAHAHAVKGVRHVPRQVKSQDELTADYKTKAKTALTTQRITTRQKLPALSKSRSNTGLR